MLCFCSSVCPGGNSILILSRMLSNIDSNSPSSYRAALALIVSVVFHPSLLTRLVLLAIIVITFITFSFVPFPRCQRLTTRITSALTGSVGTIMAICIFCGVSSWGDVWLRLVVKTEANWEGGQEQGLSAATCLLFVVGCASDWALKWKFGEDPDKVCPLSSLICC